MQSPNHATSLPNPNLHHNYTCVISNERVSQPSLNTLQLTKHMRITTEILCLVSNLQLVKAQLIWSKTLTMHFVTKEVTPIGS